LLAAFAPYCGGRKWEGLHVTMIRSEAVKDLTAGSLNRVAVDSWIPIRRRSR
jgi:hypothetical protein